MMRTLVLLVVLVVLVGCQQPRSAPVAEAPAAPVAEKTVSQPSADIDFSQWPTATERRLSVSPYVEQLCAARSSTEEEVWAGTGGGYRHGPHFKHYIIVRVNPEAMEQFKAVDGPLPVGTTVVKEKHHSVPAEGAPDEYGAMIKREPGYDPEHGDWEYLYVVQKPRKQVTRGRLEKCIECHSHVKDRDYVFRTYLPGKAKGVSEW
jgi:hypothetical protein